MSETGAIGIFARAKHFLDKILALAQTRIELLSVEFQEERCRLVEAIIWASAVVFLGAMALIVITFTIIFVLWESRETRIVALVVCSVIYLLAAIASFVTLKRKLKHVAQPFAESLHELKRDRQCLNTPS